MRYLLLFALLLLTTGLSVHAQDLVIIVNPQSGVTTLTRQEAINIFTGRYRTLPSGLVAFPIDVQGRNGERKGFYKNLLNKDLAMIDAYWARLVFSGQTSPPLQVADSATAVQLVAGNRSAIAYVDRRAIGPQVKVVLELTN
jgi:ABC-type phosphate transport system substrate-binding protein